MVLRSLAIGSVKPTALKATQFPDDTAFIFHHLKRTLRLSAAPEFPLTLLLILFTCPNICAFVLHLPVTRQLLVPICKPIKDIYTGPASPAGVLPNARLRGVAVCGGVRGKLS